MTACACVQLDPELRSGPWHAMFDKQWCMTTRTRARAAALRPGHMWNRSSNLSNGDWVPCMNIRVKDDSTHVGHSTRLHGNTAVTASLLLKQTQILGLSQSVQL